MGERVTESSPHQDPPRDAAAGSAGGTPGPRVAPASRRRLPVWVQALVIVGIGCGACLAALLFGLGAVAWWVLGPGAQVPTEAIAAESSAGVLRVEDLSDDPGVRGGVDRLAEEVALVHAERGPRDGSLWGEGGPPTFLAAMWFPSEVTLLVDRAPGEDELHVVVAANFRWFVRPARLLLNGLAVDEEQTFVAEPYAGQTLLHERDGDVGFAFVGGTLLVASDVGLLKLAIDRVLAHRSRRGERPLVLPPGMPQEQEGWDVAGVLHGDADDLRRVLSALQPDEGDRWPERFVRGQLERTTVGVDWGTVDRLRARLTLDVVDDLAVEGWMDALDEELARLAERLDPEGLQLSHALELYDGRITVDVTLEGIERLLERVARNF